MYETREEVENWLKEIRVRNYVINEDLTVDVNEDVNISSYELNEIPIQFSVVNGNFDCSNNALTNLKGFPEVINGSFYCDNNKLTDFKYFPKEIKGEYIFIYDNKIKEEELVNFNCKIENLKELYSDFNEYGYKEELLEKVHFYKSKKENELLKEISANSNNIKLNKKL